MRLDRNDAVLVVIDVQEMALFEMLAVAGTDEFRAVSRLVK